MTAQAGYTGPAPGIPAMAEGADPREPAGTRVDEARVAELCERLRQLGRQAGESALHRGRERAEALVAEARERAHTESQVEVARARERLARQRERELQAARLEARASIAWCRWRELDAVLDAAQRHADSLRDTEPERYVNALHRFLDAARLVLPPRALTLHAHPDDLARLQRAGVKGSDESETVHVGDTNIKTGLVVSSTDGGVFVDQTIASRRQRLDELLRLAAAEILFGAHEEASPIAAG